MVLETIFPTENKWKLGESQCVEILLKKVMRKAKKEEVLNGIPKVAIIIRNTLSIYC